MTRVTFKQQVVSGVSWTATSQVLVQSTTFVATVVLARLLQPADFGLVGMAAVYTGLVAMLGELGLGAAIIHRKDLDGRELDTVFWAGIGVALIIYALSFALAPLAGQFFRDETVTSIVRVSSAAFVINAFGAVHKVLLTKGLRFDRLARVEVSSAVGYGATAITLAVLGMGAWSIVAAQLARSGLEALFVWRAEPWRPHRRFSRGSLEGLLNYGLSVWGFNFVNYARENIDFLAVGRLLGASELGFYTFAYNLANLPRRQVMSVVGRVTFPAFSKIQDDTAAMRNTYIRIIRYVSLLTFPLFAGLAVVAPVFVPLVYGAKWTPSIVPLQILCGAGLLYSLGGSSGSVFLAKGRPGLLLKISLVSLAGLAVLVVVGTRWGTVGVATAVLGYTVLSLSLGQLFTNSLLELRMRSYLAALRPAAVAATVMVVGVAGYRYAASSFLSSSGGIWRLAWLGTAVLLGAAIYFLLIRVQRVPEYPEVLNYVKGLVVRLRPLPGDKDSKSTPPPATEKELGGLM